MFSPAKILQKIKSEKNIISQLPPHSISTMRVIFFIVPVIYSIPVFKDIHFLGPHLEKGIIIRLTAIVLFFALFLFSFFFKNFFIRHQKGIYSISIFTVAVNLSIIAAWTKGMYFLGIIQIEIAVATFIAMSRLRALITITGINLIYVTVSLFAYSSTEEFTRHLFYAGPPLIIFILISLLAHHIIFSYRVRDFLDNQQLTSMNTALQKEIEERKIAEAASFEAEKKLVNLNQTKDKMFSIIAHDLRGPLGNINTVLKLFLEQQSDMDTETLRDFIESLYQETENTFLLLENLLLWARNQRGDISPNRIEINISPLLEDTVEILSTPAENKSIDVQVSRPDNLTASVDPDMISTIVRNVLANAIKFTERHGRVSLKAHRKEANLIISVHDSGIGMSEETINKILDSDEFYTTHGTDNERGSGLGMKLCRQFVRAHNGTIQIESEPGAGSTFTITIPA